MIKMKNIIILLIALVSLSSCNAKDKKGEAGVTKKIKTDENTLVWSQIEPLPDYSYKNYKIEPYVIFLGGADYKMPIEIGSEWLVLYHTIENNEVIRDLKLCKIQDSIYVSLREGPHFTRYSRATNKDSIAIPVIDKTLTNPETMIFFKGFDKYNTNFANDFRNDLFSDYNEHWGENRGDSLKVVCHDFKYNGKPFSLQDTYIISDADIIIEPEEGTKSYAHYIVFKNGDRSQCLVYRQADGEILIPLEFYDLDGDGLPDPILNINYEIMTKDDEFRIYSSYSSYLLFLSSEAEDGELLKHVATKTILNSRNTFPITK
jgi:hypothetical protein